MRHSTSTPTDKEGSSWSNPFSFVTRKKEPSTSPKIGATKIFFLYQRLGIRLRTKAWIKTLIDGITTHELLPPYRKGRAVVVRVSPGRIAGIGLWGDRKSQADLSNDDVIDHHIAEALQIADFTTASEQDAAGVPKKLKNHATIWDH